MGFRNPPTYLHNPNTLRALRRAFNATWVEVQARDPFRDLARTQNSKLPSIRSFGRSLGME